MKGADQCPRCGSRSSIEVGSLQSQEFYAANTRACVNCRTMWEPFAQDDLPDPRHEPRGAFKHPCNNCAFRKGSPEQSDPEAFEELRSKLGWLGGSFYCHKGVPLDPMGEDGFAYPRDKDGVAIPRKLRLCRGYLNQLGKFPMDQAAGVALGVSDENERTEIQ